MKIVLKTYLKGVILIIALFYSCSSSKIVHTWQPANPKPNKFNTILVLALIKDNDRFTQERMEYHLAEDLNKRGYQAISALKVYGPGSFEIMSKKETFDKLKDTDIDAVMTIVLVNKAKNYIVGDLTNTRSGEIIQEETFGYYNDIKNQLLNPDYYLLNTEYFWESSLYNVNTNELVYAVQTQSFNPSSTETLAHDYGILIIKDMIRKKVF